MKTFVVVACLAAAFAKPQHPLIQTLKDLKPITSRIINGEPAVIGQFPWQAAVRITTPSGSFFCGGALINQEWILTAAHCAVDAIYFNITLGGITTNGAEEGEIELFSTIVHVHENYNPYTLNNDISVIKLSYAVNITDNIRPIALPSKGEVIGGGVVLRVSGWGKTSDASSSISNTLNYVDLKTITNNECKIIYGPTIIDSTLCCRGNPNHSTCNGDSGGPLIIQNSSGDVHVGIVSFVCNKGCESGMPSGYVRTESYLEWIHERTGISI